MFLGFFLCPVYGHKNAIFEFETQSFRDKLKYFFTAVTYGEQKWFGIRSLSERQLFGRQTVVHADFFTKTSFEKADLLSINYFKPAAIFYVISISVSQANDFLAGLITV